MTSRRRAPHVPLPTDAAQPRLEASPSTVAASNRWRRAARIAGWALLATVAAAVLALVTWEVHNSTFQSRWISQYAQGLTWELRDGATTSPLQAPRGPYDVRHGYARIPQLQRHLVDSGFHVARQADPSRRLGVLAQYGVYPPYEEKNEPALVIVGPNGSTLYNARPDAHLFRDFVDIPPVIVQALLYVENRALLDDTRPRLNPALEWDRLLLSSVRYASDRVFGTGNLSGGSTLATQVQKFRHTPGGRTGGLRDKAVQMASASLRAYHEGPDTRRNRRRIVVDYLNGLPLGAAKGVGEVRGLGEGMELWFGKDLEQLVVDLSRPEVGASLLQKGRSFKEALALILATRRPGLYLGANRTALEDRLEFYLRELARERIISWELAAAANRAPLELRIPNASLAEARFVDRKAANAIRTDLLGLLGVDGLYQLDQLDVRVASTLEVSAQASVRATLQKLGDPEFLRARGFLGKRLLQLETAGDVVYSFTLYESNPNGNRLMIQADNLDRPLDLNDGSKLELGSTAKLRTLAHYLNVVASVRAAHAGMSVRELRAAERAAQDPIRRWTLRRLHTHRGETDEALLWAAVERELPADPARFFTGGGVHAFDNFDHRFEGEVSVRKAFQHSVNLVFVRMMRELVQYYTAELGYDERSILEDPAHPQRRALLEAAADRETRQHLARAWRLVAPRTPLESVRALCGDDEQTLRRFAIFHLKMVPDASLDELRKAAQRAFPARTEEILRDMGKLHVAHGRRRYSLSDEAWLMKREPLQVWLVRDRHTRPRAGWLDVLSRSTDVRRESYRWLFHERSMHAQELRVRTELERRAFEAIHAAWRALGYPFGSLVPSLATAIGSSADRPAALADLVGIVQNEGIRAHALRIEGIYLGEGTPYETHFAPDVPQAQRVMPAEVARVLKQLMLEVVEEGTAQAVRGALQARDGVPIPIGGKTGSGDNRHSSFNKRGALVSSRAINRTASFVFFVGESHYGVVTAQVHGESAADHSFTSALALHAFNTLAPSIANLVAGPSQQVEVGAATPPRP